ncbi:histone chaperone NAP1 KNAG_0C01330 [Huiozyma naganishii CBS 8797]|uniref:Nucleosome assembly protein n=1 Tax=Huiozyma naganishii (strain ATCC MYA-139 / BCRC 22969 / CBS 8797 / KCTC 17520 / NBRC 10181 / NCYC 3082 / Yp74L-3) TaxID=1071383 RepID=J7S5M6_HUIN7|nr:hypothetical protein KNAG_0C01330 [Kazachstania naganishii CBS 8797]CCK69246.1 hypothetical protein KNAG_0C01330 [Kazachstania naganishii CBS 8797]
MSSPIEARKNTKSSMKIDNAPTPHNTPASVLDTSYMRNGLQREVPQTIVEETTTGAAPADEEETVSRLQQPLLLQSIQEKLGTLVGQDSGYVDALPTGVKRRVAALKSLQADLFEMEREFQVEMFELEKKYLAKYAPLYRSRGGIVSGKERPTGEQVAKGAALEEKLAGVDTEGEGDDGDAEGIPSFWLTALENLPVVNETITDRDAAVLEYLEDIQLEYLEDTTPGFRLVFCFSPKTPYFKDTQLVKTYYYQRELGYSGDFIYDHAEGQQIQWTDNRSNVTVELETRKQRNKNTKQVRTIEKLTPVESFFNFFDPPATGEEEEEEEDDEEELEARLALDYSIGEQIKDKLVPRAVDWFTGTALEFEFDEGDDLEEGEFDDDEDTEESDAEEADDFASAPEQAPECKQQ